MSSIDESDSNNHPSPRPIAVPQIRDILVRGLHPEASAAEVRTLVNFCHKAAISYLRPKQALYRRMLAGLSVEDVALDAIAELFDRRRGRGFPKLSVWLNRQTSIETMPEDLLWVEFRRIILGSVNQHMYRLFRTSDPSLSKTIRNIKLALKSHARLCIKEVNGITAIALRREDGSRNCLQEMIPEILEAEFLSRIGEGKSLRTMLGVLEEILRGQTEYRGTIALTTVALLFRARIACMHEQDVVSPPSDVTEDDIVQMIDGAIDRLRPAASKTYVRTAKLDPTVLDSHLGALREILLGSITDDPDTPSSYFHALRRLTPGLTEEQYRLHDRPVLEYLARRARTMLKNVAERDLGISAQS